MYTTDTQLIRYLGKIWHIYNHVATLYSLKTPPLSRLYTTFIVCTSTKFATLRLHRANLAKIKWHL